MRVTRFARTARVRAPIQRLVSPLLGRFGSILSTPASRVATATEFKRFASTSAVPVEVGMEEDPRRHLIDTFSRCKAANRPTFVAYTTVGYPEPTESVNVIRGLQDGGADVIELGMPFTDPLADGSTIQSANQGALNRGVNHLDQVLEVARKAREAGVTVPFVLMGYFNPFFHYKNKDLNQLMIACKKSWCVRLYHRRSPP